MLYSKYDPILQTIGGRPLSHIGKLAGDIIFNMEKPGIPTYKDTVQSEDYLKELDDMEAS